MKLEHINRLIVDEEKKLDAILKISLGDSPRRILEKLAEFDQQG